MKNRRIGILTFHNANNFGAVLQAYATLKFLESNGIKPEIVDYQNIRIRKKYKKNLSPYFETRKKDFIFPWRWNNIAKSINKCKRIEKEWETQWERFEVFRKNEFFLSSNNVQISDINDSMYDALIFGSDQIWNLGITGPGETVYWGKGIQNTTLKIAYAASIYNGDLSKLEIYKARKYLPAFDAISVREEETAMQLRNVISNEIRTVLDPTLLIPADYYISLIEQHRKKCSGYVLVYLVSEDMDLVNAALSIGLNVKVLHYYKWEKSISGVEEVCDAGPYEFLNLIYDADYVLTNSFHGTVFSILFDKRFGCIYKSNKRIENLLNTIGLGNAHIESIEQFDVSMFVKAEQKNYELLSDQIEMSKEYLIKSIGE